MLRDSPFENTMGGQILMYMYVEKYLTKCPAVGGGAKPTHVLEFISF